MEKRAENVAKIIINNLGQKKHIKSHENEVNKE